MPIVLFLLSLATLGFAVTQAGFNDLVLLAGPSTLAALFVLLRAWQQDRARRLPSPRYVVVDGSNVLHWKDNVPALAPLKEVLAQLTRQGLTPSVYFDANAGYKIGDRYLHDLAMARLLGLSVHQVTVVPKGSRADPAILAAARKLAAPIVTNDQYRDWVEQYPEVLTPGHRIRGGYRDGVLWLDLAPVAAAAA